MEGNNKQSIQKNEKLKRFVSLFDVPRSSHRSASLHRTNSLPLKKQSNSLSNKNNTLSCANQLASKKSKKGRKIDTKKEALLSSSKRVEISQLEEIERNIEAVAKRIEQDELELADFDDNERIMAKSFSTFERTPSYEPSNNYENIFKSCDTDDQVNSNSGSNKTFTGGQNDESNKSDSEQSPLETDFCNNSNPMFWKSKSFVRLIGEEKTIFTHDGNKDSNKESSDFVYAENDGEFSTAVRRTGIFNKSPKFEELLHYFENVDNTFFAADQEGRSEMYRKKLIEQMDLQMENMKKDGFEENLNLDMENLSLIEDCEPIDEDNGNTFNFDKTEENANMSVVSSIDDKNFFGEMKISEYLEDSNFYVEAYNADGEELVFCNLSVNRKSVDIQRFQQMKAETNFLVDKELSLLYFDTDISSTTGSLKSGENSKRNTFYSTTSGESFEDEDNENYENSLPVNNSNCETYLDKKGFVRIQRVTQTGQIKNDLENNDALLYVNRVNNYYETALGLEEVETLPKENADESLRLEHQEILFELPQKKHKLQYILDEILSTERKYLSDIQKVLLEYKSLLSEKCPSRVEVVFANLEQIYNRQTEFLVFLEEADSNVELYVEAFIEFEDLFRLYPRYFRNTPKSNLAVKELSYLLKEKQDVIQDKLDLSAYLLTPLQRLGKYKLFLENIIKELAKEQITVRFVHDALAIIKKYLRRGNDSVAIASILHSPLHTKDYGAFFAREKFTLLKPKKLEVMVFLFERVVVFAQEDSSNKEQFIYMRSIKMDDLRIATFDHDNTIHLTDFTKTKRKNVKKLYTFILDAKSLKLKMLWKQQIEEILWKQMEKLKELSIQIHQNNNTMQSNSNYSISPIKKRISNRRSQDDRLKSTGSSVFYVE